ncbi:uncharacterized protein LOC117470517 isoform X1 [Trematomus bernacchii]|uniref:uncharacterized protein LOC117470517 isoform X1 n=1 Tax=Trematomus bernacchii TaxID=40690 RepID=UPI00146CCA73|nr:uncharacterized protein LOC117470517 isoform X1 [Trematomus bernacchii]
MMKTMIQAVLLVNIFSSQLLMLHSAVHSLLASCRDDVSLTCPDVGSDFVSVTWYKQRIDQDKCGILRWSSKDKSKPEFFKSNRSVHYDYDQDYSLLISAVTPVDSGTYECEVGARVGYQNTKVEVKLDVSDYSMCADQVFQTTAAEVVKQMNPENLHLLFILKVLRCILLYLYSRYASSVCRNVSPCGTKTTCFGRKRSTSPENRHERM